MCEIMLVLLAVYAVWSAHRIVRLCAVLRALTAVLEVFLADE